MRETASPAPSPRPADTRYRAIATQLLTGLQAGEPAAGQRLPSVRQLCQAFAASPATVTHALHLLEDDGWVEARGRAGFFARPRRPPPLAPRPIQLPQAVALSDRDALTLGFRTRNLPEVDDKLCWMAVDESFYPGKPLNRIMNSLARTTPGLLTAKLKAYGQPLKDLLAQRYQALGCHWRAEESFITATHGESLYTLLQLLTRPGDVVAVQSPAPMDVLNMLDLLALRVLEIPSDPASGLLVDVLAFALKREKVAACVFSANFANPTSSLMSDEAKERTVALLAAHQVPLIEDDTLGELYFGATRPRPFKAFDQTGNVHYCADLGFLMAPGLKAGFVVAGKLCHAFNFALMAKGASPPPLLVQRTLEIFVAEGLYERHLRRLRPALASNLAAYRAALAAHFPPQARVAHNPGGILLWVEMPPGFDTLALQERALAGQAKVGFSPGRFFGVDNSFEHCLRLNAGHRFDAAIERGIATLGRLAAEQWAA